MWLAILSWVVLRRRLPSILLSSVRKPARRLSKLFQSTCSMSHITSENLLLMISLVRLARAADSCISELYTPEGIIQSSVSFSASMVTSNWMLFIMQEAEKRHMSISNSL